ncbi:MAG TPA: hypothetical protein VFV33_17580 [Gemmatimonadaceae bacterium]|nr:hypothetical protein [Gemmatimonadaceae bacterium]
MRSNGKTPAPSSTSKRTGARRRGAVRKVDAGDVALPLAQTRIADHVVSEAVQAARGSKATALADIMAQTRPGNITD